MTRPNKSIAALALVAVVALSVLVAYRSGLQRGLSAAGAGARVGAAGGGCVDFHEAAAHRGDRACVTGRVLSAFTSNSGNTFLDFCEDYRRCPFTGIIFASDRAKFGNLTTLEERDVELRGKIQIYHGQAEIVLRDPGQIREAP
jgi:hypothetical protein